MEGDTCRGYAEGVCVGVMQQHVWRGAQRWLPLETMNLVGDNREFEV